MWSCTRDEGGPLDAGGQVQASNHCKLLSSKAMASLITRPPSCTSCCPGTGSYAKPEPLPPDNIAAFAGCLLHDREQRGR
jgi:hypothetical protein